ncbi:hypothetical protein SELMODRAFT_414117 [Selaginella moellendorffii]|uniref:Uncharacterized protein n=1 Tax=Selaginella moellendorffii TaxID=88036 RepID=D8RRP7_SELML|nr:hypothetical protein SELMODRAFT_414117 [Selaginella moellendorffii]
MFVDKDDFKVGAHFISYDSGHWCYIYDSATHVWSSLPNLPFSQREERHWFDDRSVFPDFYDLSILGLYDFRRTKWITGEVVRSLRITTGLEGVEQSGEFLRCVLPHPGWCTTMLWEYNGQRYFASAWIYVHEGDYYKVGYCRADGYGVWKVDDNGGLVIVSAVLCKALLDQVYPGQSRNFCRCYIHAEDNLVIFSEGKVFVYDLDTKRWGGVGGRTYESGKGLLYHPSLMTLVEHSYNPHVIPRDDEIRPESKYAGMFYTIFGFRVEGDPYGNAESSEDLAGSSEDLQTLYPDAKVTIGPWIENDFDLKEPLPDKDLKKIKMEMTEIKRKRRKPGDVITVDLACSPCKDPNARWSSTAQPWERQSEDQSTSWFFLEGSGLEKWQPYIAVEAANQKGAMHSVKFYAEDRRETKIFVRLAYKIAPPVLTRGKGFGRSMKVLHLMRHAQAYHNVDGDVSLHRLFFRGEWRRLTPGLLLRVLRPLFITWTLQTATGVFRGADYGSDSSLPLVAVELCRERILIMHDAFRAHELLTGDGPSAATRHTFHPSTSHRFVVPVPRPLIRN